MHATMDKKKCAIFASTLNELPTGDLRRLRRKAPNVLNYVIRHNTYAVAAVCKNEANSVRARTATIHSWRSRTHPSLLQVHARDGRNSRQDVGRNPAVRLLHPLPQHALHRKIPKTFAIRRQEECHILQTLCLGSSLGKTNTRPRHPEQKHNCLPRTWWI